MRINRLGLAAAATALALLLSACGGQPSPPVESLGASAPPTSAASAQGETEGYVIPAFLGSGFTGQRAAAQDEVQLDTSATAQGYVAVSALCGSRLKFQVICGEEKYNYDLPEDGTPTVYPLQCGDGEYRFRVMRNLTGSQYVELWSATVQVELADEFQPFLRPSQWVNYTEDDDCIALARQLAETCQTDAEVVQLVYDTLCERLEYDYDKAATVQSGYLPDPDATLAEGKGICFDYAVLAAAMLRSVGVPTKLITGYVGDIYHAWNSIYLQDQGWITVEIRAKAGEWQRIDITFADTGADTAQLTDDARYVVRYTY